jgi:hypothetical protein
VAAVIEREFVAAMEPAAPPDRRARCPRAGGGRGGPGRPTVVAHLAFALVKASLPHATTALHAQRIQPRLTAGLAALLSPPEVTLGLQNITTA